MGGVGRDYAAVQLTVGGKGPYRFMVDSGLTAELITPHLQQELNISTGKAQVLGLGAGGLSAPASLVRVSWEPWRQSHCVAAKNMPGSWRHQPNAVRESKTCRCSLLGCAGAG